MIDVRGGEARFDIYKRASKEYVATQKRQGWVKSAVLGHSLRLTRDEAEDGWPAFTLEVR